MRTEDIPVLDNMFSNANNDNFPDDSIGYNQMVHQRIMQVNQYFPGRWIGDQYSGSKISR